MMPLACVLVQQAQGTEGRDKAEEDKILDNVGSE